MKDQHNTPAFSTLATQIDALMQGQSATIRSGHCDLGPDLWLSTDPAGQALLSCTTTETAFHLTLENGDSGSWASLGMHLPRKTLSRGRYFGLRMNMTCEETASFIPTLRAITEEGKFIDIPSAPVVMAGGTRDTLSYVALDHTLLALSSRCEFNLFFQTDHFSGEIHALEPLLIY